jgi:hypothetical protein
VLCDLPILLNDSPLRTGLAGERDRNEEMGGSFHAALHAADTVTARTYQRGTEPETTVRLTQGGGRGGYAAGSDRPVTAAVT